MQKKEKKKERRANKLLEIYQFSERVFKYVVAPFGTQASVFFTTTDRHFFTYFTWWSSQCHLFYFIKLLAKHLSLVGTWFSKEESRKHTTEGDNVEKTGYFSAEQIPTRTAVWWWVLGNAPPAPTRVILQCLMTENPWAASCHSFLCSAYSQSVLAGTGRFTSEKE